MQDMMQYFTFHELDKVDMNVNPEMEEMVTAYTKLLATVAHYRDGSADQSEECAKGDVL